MSPQTTSSRKDELAQKLRDMDLLIVYVAKSGKLKSFRAIAEAVRLCGVYGLEPGRFGKHSLAVLRIRRAEYLEQHKRLVEEEREMTCKRR